MHVVLISTRKRQRFYAQSLSAVPLMVENYNGFLEVIPPDGTHKYLGHKFVGDLQRRAEVGLEFRFSCSYMKWHQLRAP